MRTYAVPIMIIVACISVTTLVEPSVRPDTDLKNLQLPDVRITSITRDDARGEDGTGKVTYYDVDGVIGGTIRFELLLPDDWNERFVMGGGGGFVGTVSASLLLFPSLAERRRRGAEGLCGRSGA